MPTLRLILFLYYSAACGLAAPPNPSPFAPVDDGRATEATNAVRSTAKKAIDQLKLKFPTFKFVEKETPHFLIYADWPGREMTGLATQLEQSYTAVGKQFGVKAKDDAIFVGKMLVFAVTDREVFSKLCEDFDDVHPADDVPGYFRPHADGSGHLFVCRPAVAEDASDIDLDRARDRFAAMLARELTLAFLDRYANKAELPGWLNRGIATLVQRSLVPGERIDPGAARYLASSNFDLTIIFDPELPAGPHFDAAAMSLVEMLLEQDRDAFINMLHLLKNGARGETALEKSFHLTYLQAAEQWRRHIQTR